MVAWGGRVVEVDSGRWKFRFGGDGGEIISDVWSVGNRLALAPKAFIIVIMTTVSTRRAVLTGVVAVLLSVGLLSCQGPRTMRLAELEHPEVAVRIRAIKWAGENRVSEAVPLLVDRLSEQDPSVRFFAIGSLRRITGTDHGYDYKANATRRSAAVARWREAIGQSGAGAGAEASKGR